MPQISVLIPVHNAEKYLQNCLLAVQRQTFTDFEIVCIDDGSTDHSGDMLRQFQTHEPRLKIITQKNVGLAITRNRLMKAACGRYIAFVDADDIVMPRYLETLYAAAEEYQVDMAMCAIANVPENFTWNKSVMFQPKGKKQLFPEGLAARFQIGYKNNPVWNKLFRLDWINEKNLQFYDKRVAEDFLFSIVAFLEAKRVAYVPDVLYLYRQGVANSITSKKTRLLLDKYQHVFTLRNEIKQRGLWNQELAGWWIRAVIRRMIGLNKVDAAERPKNPARVQQACLAIREELPGCNWWGRIRGTIFLYGAQRLKGTSVFLWSKLFR